MVKNANISINQANYRGADSGPRSPRFRKRLIGASGSMLLALVTPAITDAAGKSDIYEGAASWIDRQFSAAKSEHDACAEIPTPTVPGVEINPNAVDLVSGMPATVPSYTLTKDAAHYVISSPTAIDVYIPEGVTVQKIAVCAPDSLLLINGKVGEASLNGHLGELQVSGPGKVSNSYVDGAGSYITTSNAAAITHRH